ncbi:unnamed protein product [Vitrella brassicaformis CCMP3155]|uniref:Uncharacterized protein n=1 Tax=Vitrella brassicaformis (strain CCMP3155) TaxID=1169540 RepID=A0A0G4G6K4_VITBC|nr:unnamed protein product [Vitrella brassicaformis CCMP3155]|eukprot:CEM23981.1 unnamed protein product [Vitrella brassicaformis CCMP3155]
MTERTDVHVGGNWSVAEELRANQSVVELQEAQRGMTGTTTCCVSARFMYQRKDVNGIEFDERRHTPTPEPDKQSTGVPSRPVGGLYADRPRCGHEPVWKRVQDPFSQRPVSPPPPPPPMRSSAAPSSRPRPLANSTAKPHPPPPPARLHPLPHTPTAARTLTAAPASHKKVDTATVSAAALEVVLTKCRAMTLPHNVLHKLHKASECNNTLSALCHSVTHAMRHELPSGPLCLMIHHCDSDEPHSHAIVMQSSPTLLKPPDVPPTHTLTSAIVYAVMLHIKTNSPSVQLPVTSKTVKLCVAMTIDGSGRGFVSLQRGEDMMLKVGGGPSETDSRWYLADIETEAAVLMADDIELWAIR